MGKIFGFELWKLRFLTVLISYLGSLLFFRTCQDQKIPSPLLKTLILIFFPYIFLYSFTIYTIHFYPLLGNLLFAIFFEVREIPIQSRSPVGFHRFLSPRLFQAD